MLTSVLVARILGPGGRGLVAVATTFSAIGIQFLNLGLQSSNTYFVSKDRSLLPSLIGNSLVWSFLVGGGVALFALFAFHLWPSLSPLDGDLLLVSLIWIPIGLTYLFSQNLLIGINAIRTYNKTELFTKILNVTLILGILAIHKVNPLNIFFLGFITMVFGSFWAYGKLFLYAKQFPSPSLGIFKSSFGYGIKAYLSALFAFLVIRVDLLMIKYLLNEDQAGYYSIAANLADLIYMLPIVIGTILFPKLSAMKNNNDKWAFTKNTLTWSSILMFIFILIIAFLAQPLIRILFGVDFIPATPALLFLLPGIFFLSVQTIAAQHLNSIGFPRSLVIFWGLTTILNLVLNFYAIPKYGIAGASMVSTASYFFIFILVLILLRRHIGDKE